MFLGFFYSYCMNIQINVTYPIFVHQIFVITWRPQKLSNLSVCRPCLKMIFSLNGLVGVNVSEILQFLIIIPCRIWLWIFLLNAFILWLTVSRLWYWKFVEYKIIKICILCFHRAILKWTYKMGELHSEKDKTSWPKAPSNFCSQS